VLPDAAAGGGAEHDGVTKRQPPRDDATFHERRRRLELRPEALRRRVGARSLRFRSTAEVDPLVGTVGQPRALDAIAFGVDTTTPGFNLFVAGASGSGRLQTVLDLLALRAQRGRAPDDWVYVHNFRNPERPRALRLPARRGVELAQAVDELLEAARRELPRAFESEEYERRQREVMSDVAEQRSKLEEELTQFAAEHEHALQPTLAGVVSMPLIGGKPVTREEFEHLPPEQQASLYRHGKEIEEHTAMYAHQLRQLEKEAARRLKQLEQQEVALFTTGPLFRDLEERFADQPEVVAHLADLKRELLANVADFRDGDERAALPFRLAGAQEPTARFRVNVLVDHDGDSTAPVVVETNPTYYNLLGRVDYRAAFGSMVTDFQEIHAGALHRANGGFLVIDALELPCGPSRSHSTSR
jgi:hypothetical protein